MVLLKKSLVVGDWEKPIIAAWRPDVVFRLGWGRPPRRFFFVER